MGRRPLLQSIKRRYALSCATVSIELLSDSVCCVLEHDKHSRSRLVMLSSPVSRLASRLFPLSLSLSLSLSLACPLAYADRDAP